MSREYPQTPLVGVGVVVTRGRQILLVKRGHEPGEGRWTIPGGLVELGETVREAAKREVAEECGIEIEVGDVVSVVDSIVKDNQGDTRFHFVLIDFQATHLRGELTPGSDALDARWVSPEELSGFDLPEMTRKVIEKALR